MIKKWKAVVTGLVVLLALAGTQQSAFADTKTSEQEELAAQAGFNYQVIYPENQKSDVGYFDLEMESAQKQTLEIMLSNLGPDEVKVNVDLNGARTNPNGVLEYGQNKLAKDKSMKFDFKDIVKAPTQVVVPGDGEAPLKIEITMPETSYDGVVMGGVQLRLDSEEKPDKNQGGTQIINEYAYTIGVVLSESAAKLEPDLTFVKASAQQPELRNTIVIDLGNPVAMILTDLAVEAQIMTEKNDEVLYEAKKTKMRMAPNTILNFQVGMNDQEMQPGMYRAHVLATSGEQTWEWTEPFEITREEADRFNREAIGLVQERAINWKLISGIVLGTLAILITVYLVIQSTNKRAAENKKRSRRKRKST